MVVEQKEKMNKERGRNYFRSFSFIFKKIKPRHFEMHPVRFNFWGAFHLPGLLKYLLNHYYDNFQYILRIYRMRHLLKAFRFHQC